MLEKIVGKSINRKLSVFLASSIFLGSTYLASPVIFSEQENPKKSHLSEIAYANESEEKMTNSAKLAIYEAQTELSKGNYQKTISTLEKFLKKKPKENNYLIEFIIGTSHALLKNYEKSAEHLEKSAQLNPVYCDTQCNLGKVYYQIKEFKKAGESFEKCFNLSPQKNDETLYMAMVSYFQSKGFDKSISCGNIAIKDLQSKKEEIHLLLASSYAQKEEYQKSIDVLQNYLDINYSSADTWKFLAQLYYKNKDLSKATITFDIFTKIKEPEKDDIKMLGDLYFMIGIPKKAAECYEKSISSKESVNTEDLERLAISYYYAYEYDKAIETLNKIPSDKINNEHKIMKSQIFYLKEDYKSAMQMYADLAKNTKDGHEWLMAGYCALRIHDHNNAKKFLNAAKQYPSTKKDAESMLLQVHDFEADFKRAMEVYEEQLRKSEEEINKNLMKSY